MDDLNAYFSIIEPRLLSHVKGKPAQFIRLYLKQKYLSEEAFKERICGKKHGQSYYSTLHTRTIKILQALAIISTPKGASIVKKKYDLCQKKFAIGQKFLNQGQRSEGLRVIKKAHNLAVKYDFSHLACELSSILYRNHINYDSPSRKTEHYAEQVNYYLYNYTAEKKAEYHYFKAIGQINRSLQPELIQQTIEKVERLKGTSIRFKVYETTLKSFFGFHTGNYTLVINTCINTISFLQNKEGVYSSHNLIFSLHLGIAQMAMAQYEKAEESFTKAEKFAPVKSRNDYAVRFYKTLNAIHSGQYQRAYQLYQKNKRCRFPDIKQQFAIIEAYLYFLAHLGQLLTDKPFRLGKYLNETFKAQEDKQGDNINIIIAELLVYLVRNKGKFIDRVEAVKSYSYRHLKDKDTQRAKWFIRLLCTLPRANFHPIALKRLAKKQVDNLNNYPIRMGVNFAVEIIPFGQLLEMIMTELKQKVA